MIWLIGSKGMLGSEIAKQLTQHKIPWIGTNSEVDITNYQELESFEKSLETTSYYPSPLPHAQRKVQWIINCSGYSDINNAENDFEKCNSLNILGTQNIARLCRNVGCKLIHISSSYVFDGLKKTSYTEQDEPNPLNVYGKSKLQAENEISRLMNTYYIIRTSFLYNQSKENFVTKLIENINSNSEISVSDKQTISPTNCQDLVEVILKLIEKSENATSLFGKNSAPNYGIYNYTNSGSTTLFNFALTVYKYGKKAGKITSDCEISPSSQNEDSEKNLIPLNTALNSEKISKTLKIKVPGWDSSLDKFFKIK